jgi:DNA-binding transcriptional LysR family regulator
VGIAVELRQLQQFVVLAETLNFRGAAERLNMTQPPLSVSIRKMEEEFGVKLFTRTTHSVRLTNAGNAVLNDARKALFHAGEVARTARATAVGESGRLRIGFVGSAKYSFLPRQLPAFRKLYPAVALEMLEETNTTIVESLDADKIDLGIVRIPFSWRGPIKYIPVEQDVFVVALPHGHRLAGQTQVALAEVANEPFISYMPNAVPGLQALTMFMFQEVGCLPRVTQEAVQVETVLCLVESGLGIALVPSIVTKSASDRLVFRPLKQERGFPSIGLALAYNPSFETAVARRFRELAVKDAVTFEQRRGAAVQGKKRK